MPHMRHLTRIFGTVSLIALAFLLLPPPGFAGQGASFKPIAGFSAEANRQLAGFFKRTHAVSGRRVAVFDGDGTVLGQAPHYLADECLYEDAQEHPDQRPRIIKEMQGQSNVSLPYVQNRVRFLAGTSLEDLRMMGRDCFTRLYDNKIYPPMRSLIDALKRNGFEIWIVSASPEAMYQGFLSDALGIPITHIIGVKSVVRGGIVTDEIIPPVPQDKGKKEAIETFVQERPLLVAGNSRGDKEMIEYSRDLRVIVNPDEHVAPDQEMSVADYAREQGWLIIRTADVTDTSHPWISSSVYGIKLNKEHPGK
jgi:phosphoserine phosphatase